VAGLVAALSAAPADGGAFEVALTVPAPPGIGQELGEGKLTPLPVGKKLAAALYVDWQYRAARDALPLAETFHAHGWRATFFLAGAHDIKEFAPRLEALGHEVATNLLSGGIHAYRDEMFSYSPQDILNAIGPLRAELNAVLERPVIYQLVRGHSVPYRDRIRGLGVVGATHWYQHFVFHGRAGARESVLSMYAGRGKTPVAVERRLDEGVLEKALTGKKLAVILGDSGFKGDYASFLAKHSRRPECWYTTLGELASSLYLAQKARATGVRLEAGQARVSLALEEDVNPLFLRAPVRLDLSGKVLGISPEPLLSGPLEAKIAFSPPRIRLPGEAKMAVTLTNRGREKIAAESIAAGQPAGFRVAALPGAAKPLAPGQSLAIEAVVASDAAAGTHSFGFVPFPLRIRYSDGRATRTLLAAAELEVRPALRVDVYPHDGVPLGPKGSQTFQITVDNFRAGVGRGNWRNLRPRFEKFILPPEGAVEGRITFPSSDAFRVEPKELDLTLAAEGKQKVFHVTVTNAAPAKRPYILWPRILLAGDERPLLLPFGGTEVHHVAALGKPHLDDKGLLMHATWDKTGDLPHVDRARGRTEAYRGAMGYVSYGQGVVGRAALHKTTCLLDPWLNFNEAEGTMMFWLRDDPSQKKPLRANMAERLFAVGTQHPAPNVDTGQLSLRLHGQGFLLARMMTVGPVYHEVKAPFKKSDQWNHVALIWSCPKKLMQIIADGEVRGELKDDGKTWYPIPCRRWPEHYGDFMTPLSDDHGTYTSTMRDEFRLYNRPLTVEEIREHIERIRAQSKN
jgi:hypothetical protein